MPTRQAIIDEVRTWLGTPYRHQGRLKGVGVDCIGMIGMSAYALGIDGAYEWYCDLNMHNYGPTPDPRLLVSSCNRFMERVPLATVQVADVLYFRFGKEPQHFAIVSNMAPMRVIHAYRVAGKCAEQSLPIAKAHVMRAYQFKGLTA